MTVAVQTREARLSHGNVGAPPGSPGLLPPPQPFTEAFDVLGSGQPGKLYLIQASSLRWLQEHVDIIYLPFSFFLVFIHLAADNELVLKINSPTNISTSMLYSSGLCLHLLAVRGMTQTAVEHRPGFTPN